MPIKLALETDCDYGNKIVEKRKVKKSKIKYILKITLLISYMVFIYLFSEYKFPIKIPGEGDKPSFDIFPLLHMCEFGLLSLLLMLTFYDKFNFNILLSISILYGIFDEIHQYFVPYRWFDYKDILCNVIGSISGIIGFMILILIYNYFFVFPKIKWGR